MTSIAIALKIARRETKRIFTNKDIRLMVFIAPLLYGVILTGVYSQGRMQKVAVGIIDNDNTQISRLLSRQLNSTEGIFIKERFLDQNEAQERILQGDIFGIIHIPRHFSSTLKKGKASHFQLAVSSSNFLLANPVIQSTADVAMTLSAMGLYKGLTKKGVMRDKAKAIISPLNLTTEMTYNPQLNYSSFMVPALLFAILQQIILVSLSFTMADEREKGQINSLFSLCEKKIFPLLIGKALPYVAINFMIALLFIFIALPLFGLSIEHHLLWAIFFVLLFIVAVTMFGMMISAFFKTTTMALIVLMFYSMPVFFMSGISWPTSGMSLPTYLLGRCFPSTYFFRDWRLLVLGNIDITHTLGSVFIFCGFILISTIITAILYRFVLLSESRKES